MRLTVEELVTELVMSSTFQAHIVVEGATDKRLFDACMSSAALVNVIPADGCDNVVAVVARALATAAHVPVLGVIDRDYRHPLNKLPAVADVELSDLRDIECMIANSPAFDALLSEFGSSEKMHKVGGPAQARKIIVESSSVVGKFRFLYRESDPPVSFKGLDLERLVDKGTLAVDQRKLLRNLGQLQKPIQDLPAADITRADSLLAGATFNGAQYFTDQLLVCSGHDIVALLSIGLRRALGTHTAEAVKTTTIASALRLAYAVHFKKSPLASRIANWLCARTGLAAASVWH